MLTYAAAASTIDFRRRLRCRSPAALPIGRRSYAIRHCLMRHASCYHDTIRYTPLMLFLAFRSARCRRL